MIRKAIIVGMTLGATTAGLLYVVSFRSSLINDWSYYRPSVGVAYGVLQILPPRHPVITRYPATSEHVGFYTKSFRMAADGGLLPMPDLMQTPCSNVFRVIAFGGYHLGVSTCTVHPGILNRLSLHTPLVIPLILFASYPTFALIRGPLRRWRRKKRGLCLKCGYNLTGNTSGVCPECGKAR